MAVVVVWVVHTLLSKTLPQMQDRFDKMQLKQMDFFAAVMAAERESCEKRHKELREDWQTLTHDQRENHRQNLGNQQEVRHYLKDVANSCNLRSLAERAEKAIKDNEARQKHPADGHDPG